MAGPIPVSTTPLDTSVQAQSHVLMEKVDPADPAGIKRIIARLDPGQFATAAGLAATNSAMAALQALVPSFATSSAVTAQLNTAINGLASIYVLQTLLVNYATVAQLSSATQNLVSQTALNNTLSAYWNTAQVQAAITARLPAITPDGSGIHVLLPDGSTGNITYTSVTPASSAVVYSLASSTTLIPGTFASVDPAVLLTSNALVPGTAGIQTNALGDVLALIEPVNKYRFTAGYGNTRYTTGGPGGFPKLVSTSSSTNNGYEALVGDPSIAFPMVGPQGATAGFLMVYKPTGTGASGLFRIDFQDGTHFYVTGQGTQGGIHVEQNNGAAVGDEANNTYTAFSYGVQMLMVFWDGSKFWVFRNGIKTLVTNPGTIGGSNVAPKIFQLMNNAQAEVSLIELFLGCPSIAEHQSRLNILAGRYGFTAGTVVEGPSAHINPVPIDTTATWLTTPNFPIQDVPPTRAAATPGNGITLATGATQIFSLSMGSGSPTPNVLTTTDLYKYVYTRYLVGNQTDMTDTVNCTGTSNPACVARARHYADGDPNNIHPVLADGLHMRAIGSNNRTNVSYGKVWAAMIRLGVAFYPGCVIKIRYQSYAGAHGWFALWLYSGLQFTPGPGGNPYLNYGTNRALIRTAGGGRAHEIDINDNFPRPDTGTPIGQQLDFASPDIYGMQWTGQAPYKVYSATGSGYTYYPGANPPHFRNANINWATGQHNLVLDWGTDNILSVLEDGVLVQQNYMEYDKADTYVDANNVVQQMPMHLLLSNEAGATFTPGYDTMAENDGITDGWTAVVSEISAWKGNIANRDSYKPS